MGIMLETASERLSARGGPHWASPDKLPARRLATIAAAGELAIPFTTGILIGIGETRQERLEALLEIRALGERHGHVQEVIVQNFRAKPGTRMAGHPEPSLDDHLWTIAAARDPARRRTGPIQAPPNLAYDDFPRLLDAGIDDWGGVSPVTIDHVNPEAPWPEVERLAEATRGRGLELAPRLPIYPRYVAELERWCDPAVATAVLRRSDSLGLAREDSWSPGEGSAIPFAPSGASNNLLQARNALPLDSRDELGEEEIVRLFRARGHERDRVLAAADALRLEVNGDTVTYVVNRNINYTNVCYFRCGFCAFSKGKLAANLRGPAYLVPLEEIVRRCREAWDRGATEVCLQGGIHPAFTGDYYLGVVRVIKDALPELHVHAFSPLEVWQGAATLGLELGDYLARLRDAGLGTLPGTAAEVLDDEVRTRPLPRQGHDRAVARGHADRARRRSALDVDAHVRPRRRAAELGAPPPPAPRAPAGDRRLHRVRASARSCTWRHRSGSRAAPARARRSARRCSSTRSRGSRCTRGSRTSRPPGSRPGRTAWRRSCARA